jgi:acyl-CoA synthetase (AMP-forming)/AMP-acid ligase II
MRYRSRQAHLDVPDTTLTEFVLAGAGRHPDRAALIDAATGERLTYGELVTSVLAGAAGLAGLGIRAGDVVAVLSHNQPRYAVAVHAALTAGATVTPANPLLTPGELTAQLAASRAKAIITSEQAAERAVPAAKATGIEHVIVLGESGGLTRFTDLLTGDPLAEPVRLDPRTAVAALPFSSGTTGRAKGVQLTHHNLVANLEQNRDGRRIAEDDVLAGVLPFFHIYGFVIILNSALLAGATVVTLPRYELTSYLRMLAEHAVTRAYFAPPMVLALATAPEVDGYDLSSVRYGICGAAPLDVAVAERAERRLGCRIRQGYGMTEAAPGTHQVADAEFATTPAGSVGRLLPGTEARLVDPVTGEDVAVGAVGELWVRGPQVMLGYLDAPQATTATVRDGWLRTGDLLRADEDGRFWVVDRLKELIKYKGYQVAPAELEAVLIGHPGVLDAAVVGVPDAAAGELPKAFVVADGPVDPDRLMAWVAERVAPYKKIRAVEFVAAIPKSPTGKILRRLLKRE